MESVFTIEECREQINYWTRELLKEKDIEIRNVISRMITTWQDELDKVRG